MAAAAVNLSVPAPADDSMEMSSPGHHNNFDEDIIDFDEFEPEVTGVHVNDDDRMMDDGEDTRPATATDDVMEDDMQHSEQTVVQEEVMQDSPSHAQPLEDEDLIDYSDDELQDEIVEDAGAPDVVGQPIVTAPVSNLQVDDIDEEVVRSPGDVALEQAAGDVAEVTTVTEETSVPLATEDEIAIPQDITDADDVAAAEGGEQLEQAAYEAYDENVEEHTEQHTDEQAGTGLEDQLATDDGEASRPTISLDTSAQPSADGPATPTDTGLHAMIVRFGEFQFPLFKSRNQPDGLLKNDNLASLSLGELIQNCRQRLAIKTGETISEDQDLVLGFDQLGLILVEDSRAAFEASLDEVLDVYLQLHRNDNTEEIPPFSLNLSLQLKFTSSISVLKQAAAGGEGMSTFGFAHSGEEHVGEYDGYAQGEQVEEGQDGYDEQYQQGEFAEEQEHEQATQAEGSIPEQQEPDTNDYYGEHQEQQTEYQGQEDYYQENDQYQEDFGEEQHHEGNQDEAAHLLDDHALEGNTQVDESAEAVLNAQDEQAAVAEESAQPSFEVSAGDEKNASAATSTTFQDDDGQDTNGEYSEEDLIDWDDDLTSDPSEQPAADAVDFSTLLEDNGDEGQDQGATLDAQQQDDLEHDVTHAGEHTAESTHPEVDAQNLGSEDFFGDLEDQQYGDGNAEPAEGYDAAAAEQHEGFGQEYDQADESAEQQEDLNHPDYQAGEEDEQFQTAHELFDGADYEQHGPEYAATGDEADETTLVASATNGEQHGNSEDFIDFDEDEPTFDEKAKKAEATPAGSRTPLAKRSFEDLGDDEIDFDSPEPKKQKAS